MSIAVLQLNIRVLAKRKTALRRATFGRGTDPVPRLKTPRPHGAWPEQMRAETAAAFG